MDCGGGEEVRTGRMIRQRDIGHMPFEGHRTQAEVRLDEERKRYAEELKFRTSRARCAA